MNDKRLLRFYLERGSAEAQRWNLSPGNLAAELSTRTLVREWVKPRRGYEVCNLGIGVGEWDDYLGYWLEGRGTLTSVDDDADICAVFRHRQKRERHPNPSRVLCRDLLAPRPPLGPFDLVTLVGSTASEAGRLDATVSAGLSLLKPGGGLFCLGFHRQRRPKDFRAAIRRSRGFIEKAYESHRHPPAYFAFLARQALSLKADAREGRKEGC